MWRGFQLIVSGKVLFLDLDGAVRSDGLSSLSYAFVLCGSILYLYFKVKILSKLKTLCT